jgi:hypothetical protein
MYARLQLLDCGTHSSQTSPPLPSLPALRSASVFDPPEQLSRKERKLIQKVFFVSVNIIHRKLCASHAAPEVVISLQGLLRSAFVCVCVQTRSRNRASLYGLTAVYDKKIIACVFFLL